MSTKPDTGWSARHETLAKAAGKTSWAAWILEIEAARGYAICGRQTKQTKAPCPQREASGVDGKIDGPCKWHGGASLAGPAAPAWRHGDEARAGGIRRSLRDRLEANLDAEPRKMMALAASFLMARFDDLVEQMDLDAAGPGAMMKARELLAEMRESPTAEAMAGALKKLEDLVRTGAAAGDALEEFYKLVPMIGQHAERYRRVMETAGEYVERERALLLFDRFGRDVVDLIDGREDLTAEQKREIRRGLAGIILGYTNRRVLPPPAEEPT